MDGENVYASDHERELAEDLRCQERQLGARLDVKVPAAAWDRVALQMEGEVARHRLHRFRYRTLGGIASAVAAAAAILLAMTLLRPGGSAPTNAPQPGSNLAVMDLVPLETLAGPVHGPDDPEIEQLSEEIDQFHADLMLDAEPAGPLMSAPPVDGLGGSGEDLWPADPFDDPVEP
jgi:hypothetical protein